MTLGSTLGYVQGWQARLLLLRGEWTAAADLVAEPLRRVPITAIPRNAYLVLACGRARRGDPDIWTILDDALALALPTRELARIGPLYAARAEAAWLAGAEDVAREEARKGFALAVESGNPWMIAELGYWRWRVGDLETLPAGARGAFAVQVSGKWAEAAAEWQAHGCTYYAGMALIDGGDSASACRPERWITMCPRCCQNLVCARGRRPSSAREFLQLFERNLKASDASHDISTWLIPLRDHLEKHSSGMQGEAWD